MVRVGRDGVRVAGVGWEGANGGGRLCNALISPKTLPKVRLPDALAGWMEEFLQISLSFPTVVFTAILLVLGLYWFLVILGAIDLDFLDFDFDLDVDVDVDVDVDLDVDVDVGAGVEGFATGFVAGVAAALGIGRVPVTVILSFLMLSAWLISFAAVFYLTPLIGGWSALAAVVFGVGSLIVALPVTMGLMRPLVRFFDTGEEPQGGAALIGQVCMISTSRVDAGFGQATLADGGAGLIVQVRCADAGNGLTRQARALIIDYDPQRHVYVVEPYDDVLGGGTKGDAVVLSQQFDALTEAADSALEKSAVIEAPGESVVAPVGRAHKS